MKKALIVGSEGQDGTLLKSLLRLKNYRVFGVGRNDCKDFAGLDGYMAFDLAGDNYTVLESFIRNEKPEEIYYVAAFHQSSEGGKEQDFAFIEKSVKVNQMGFIRVMEIVRLFHPDARIVYTSSSLVFSESQEEKQDEQTSLAPGCIYSVTKCAAMNAAMYYRKVHGLFVSIGIMYNHESSLRNDHFLSKKIINDTRRILNNEIKSITIGSLSAVTDWGYAPDYVNALWHILQLNKPDTFIVSSGQPHKVQDWFEVLFGYLKMDWREIVNENPSLLTRKKAPLIGDNRKLLSTGWKPEVTFEEMVIKIFNNDI